jgi:hypothetical protein
MTNIEARSPDIDRSTSSRIPTFKTIEEEAEFWDTHDLTEFADELEEVHGVSFYAVESPDVVTLRFTGEELAALAKRAREQQISPAALAWRWVMERLADDS